jgi:hypothetical protein
MREWVLASELQAEDKGVRVVSSREKKVPKYILQNGAGRKCEFVEIACEGKLWNAKERRMEHRVDKGGNSRDEAGSYRPS